MGKNLIYTCLFKNTNYIDLLYLWMKSLCLYGNINKNTTSILIYTSQSFANDICLRMKDFEEYKIPIYFHTYEGVDSTMQACVSRLQIFYNSFINQYDKILYLDTDILFNNDVNSIFNLDILDDRIYATKSGYIGHEYWGSYFFDFDVYDKEMPGLCSGAILFKNSQIIRDLFNKINDYIWYILNTDKTKITDCYDQPFINYIAITENKYDNQLLNPYITNLPNAEYDSNFVILHFAGNLGNGEKKYDAMLKYMDIIKAGKHTVSSLHP